MTARTFEVDDLAPTERRATGVRISEAGLLGYSLTVLATDVEGVVVAAGGWLCDRVRAGWQVTVLVPPGSDVRALTILGVSARAAEFDADALRTEHPAALALDAGVLRLDAVRREVLRTVDAGGVEVTVWGESALFAADRRFSGVRHRLSTAALAFKARAVLSLDLDDADPAVEDFVGSALWYPPDGSDLVPIAGSR